MQKVSSSDIRVGTSISVRNLFYNTPVRLKYLKNLYAELAVITEYINKMALSYPNIKFTLVNNDKTLFKNGWFGKVTESHQRHLRNSSYQEYDLRGKEIVTTIKLMATSLGRKSSKEPETVLRL